MDSLLQALLGADRPRPTPPHQARSGRSVRTLWMGMGMLGCAALSACGFQLRGLHRAQNFPFQSLVLEAEPPELRNTLLNLLTLDPQLALVAASSPPPAAQEATQHARLTVSGEKLGSQIRTVNLSGQASEYTLLYQIDFRLQCGHGEARGASLALTRSYNFQVDNVLSSDAQRGLLLEDMRHDAAQQIVERIAVHPQGHSPCLP